MALILRDRPASSVTELDDVKLLAPVLPGSEVTVTCRESSPGRSGLRLHGGGPERPARTGSASPSANDGGVVDRAAGARQRRAGPTDDLADLGTRLAGRSGAAVSDHALLLPVLRGRAQRFQPVTWLACSDGPPPARDVFRHLFTFACVLLDRLFLLSNRLRHFRIDAAGVGHVTSALAQARGCVLLGSHLGSFEVLRAFARQSPVPVKILMYRANSGAYSRLVERLDPTLADAIIEIGTPEAMLRVRESLERGEMVGILADRAPAGQKMVSVPFLGDPASLPTGPLSAVRRSGRAGRAVLRCPHRGAALRCPFRAVRRPHRAATLTPRRGCGGLGSSLCGTA